MNIVVQKYGGTSVENKEKLLNIAKRVIEYKNKGYDLVIVVSAQGNMTDDLILKANTYSKNPDLKSMDILLSTGEMQTVALLCLILEDLGISTIGLTSGMTGIITTSEFGNAKILNVYTENIINNLKNGKVIIVSGFQGMDKLGNITTLGRGGSDLSAVALASSLNAKKCELYKDVDGILSSDPKIIDKTILQKNVTYNEMLEAASCGSNVLHNRCVKYAKNNNLKLNIKNSLKDSSGTEISKKNTSLLNEKAKVKLITKKDNLAKVSIISDMISECENVFSTSLKIAEKLKIKIHMISYNELSLNILIDAKMADLYMKELHKKLIH